LVSTHSWLPSACRVLFPYYSFVPACPAMAGLTSPPTSPGFTRRPNTETRIYGVEMGSRKILTQVSEYKQLMVEIHVPADIRGSRAASSLERLLRYPTHLLRCVHLLPTSRRYGDIKQVDELLENHRLVSYLPGRADGRASATVKPLHVAAGELGMAQNMDDNVRESHMKCRVPEDWTEHESGITANSKTYLEA